MSSEKPELSAAERKYYARHHELLFVPPTAEEREMLPKVLAMFEGREAIYQEWGFLRVRVLNLQQKAAGRMLHFDVEEVLTPGLGVGAFKSLNKEKGGELIRWESSVFFENMMTLHWGFEQLGATFNFNPEVIAATVNRAAAWPKDMDPDLGYDELCDMLYEMQFGKNSVQVYGERVFPMDALLNEYLSAMFVSKPET